MSNPFSASDGPFVGLPDIGFGIDPAYRRAVREARQEARREFREQLRDQAGGRDFQAGGRDFPFGFAGFPTGPGFPPPPLPGFPPGLSLGFGRRRGRRGRGRRGDVRAAILVLLAERPMHGYEMIQEIGERSQNLWRPSPGSVYPALQLLVGEGLIVGSDTEGSRRLFELTDVGRAAAEKVETPPWEEIAESVDPSQFGLGAATNQLLSAMGQFHGATPEQQQRIIDIVNKARREIYMALSEDE